MSEHRSEILKGNLDDTQAAALHTVLDELAAKAQESQDAAPHTLGHWGRQTRTAAPTGFRNPTIEQA